MNAQAIEHTEAADDRAGELEMPVLAEDVAIEKHIVETGRVLVQRVTRETLETVAEPLMHETIEISRTPVGAPIDDMPAVREEGDTIVIPVVEERLLLQRQLFLREEVRLRRVRSTTVQREAVRLRHHELVITRSSPESDHNRNNSEQESGP